ncbi:MULTISPECIES: hypothetical protein [unclassified Neisseria]|uniref:hypothetical protein n=1 Tax=unclassified Neisseria TaxID=2623750 RepID=UPI0026665ECE|nr:MULTISPECIES: hypothetical protein [unclassified Neisseria]MDO1510949.1 hypothetical protein [Neisseria sp. MVDL19-042950]MDO1517211.1 hypothetical protein [Neisseria sp. MVDL18-041461]MDO1564574.1 hypothetical protein [Neisseria sp. MVDL20-010259]
MREQAQDLRELMIINKARNVNLTISTKSLLIFMTTWVLWLLTAYFIINDHRTLLYNPIIGAWTLADLLKVSVAFVLVQLNILLIWSICVTRKKFS